MVRSLMPGRPAAWPAARSLASPQPAAPPPCPPACSRCGWTSRWDPDGAIQGRSAALPALAAPPCFGGGWEPGPPPTAPPAPRSPLPPLPSCPQKLFSQRSDRVKSVELHPTEPWCAPRPSSWPRPQVRRPWCGSCAPEPAQPPLLAAAALCRILASLYNGHVYIWNYAEQVPPRWPAAAPRPADRRGWCGAAASPGAASHIWQAGCCTCATGPFLFVPCSRWSSLLRSQTCLSAPPSLCRASRCARRRPLCSAACVPCSAAGGGVPQLTMPLRLLVQAHSCPAERPDSGCQVLCCASQCTAWLSMPSAAAGPHSAAAAPAAVGGVRRGRHVCAGLQLQHNGGLGLGPGREWGLCRGCHWRCHRMLRAAAAAGSTWLCAMPLLPSHPPPLRLVGGVRQLQLMGLGLRSAHCTHRRCACCACCAPPLQDKVKQFEAHTDYIRCGLAFCFYVLVRVAVSQLTVQLDAATCAQRT